MVVRSVALAHHKCFGTAHTLFSALFSLSLSLSVIYMHKVSQTEPATKTHIHVHFFLYEKHQIPTKRNTKHFEEDKLYPTYEGFV